MDEMEKCQVWTEQVTLQIDFALSCFFVVYFAIRFVAADDKVMFAVSMESMVDFFTVPPVFLASKLKFEVTKLCHIRCTV